MTYDLEYFASRTKGVLWGEVIEDDKYWDEEELQDNFLCFYVYTFAHLGLPAPTRMQLEIANYISNRENPHRLVWSPRGISKSLSSQIYVVWRLYRNPDEHILVLSKSGGRATSYTQFVQKLIGTLPATSNMKPRNNIERTSGSSFDVAGSMISDSPSVYASGVGNSITGMRASMLIIDDVEDHLTVQSMALQERVQHGVDEAHNLLMSGHDESITLATPHSQNSLYLNWLETGTHAFICSAEYPEDQDVYMGFLAPFIKERLDANPSLVGQAIDERLNAEFLNQKRLKIGKSKFMLQYMADVSQADTLKHPLKLADFIVTDVSDEDAPLKIGYSSMPDNMLFGVKHNGFKADRLYTPMYQSDERIEYQTKIMSIDPSGSGKDEHGISILYLSNTRIFIKKVTGLQGGYDPDTLTNIARMCEMYDINIVVTEDNYGDGAFARVFQPYLKAISPNTGMDGIKVSGQKEVRIIEIMEPMLNQHKLIIDKDALEKDHQSLTKYSFTFQMSHITREKDCLKHDDRLDSLANGVAYITSQTSADEEFGLERYIEEELEKTRLLNESVFAEFDSGFSSDMIDGFRY
jgi:hypothetical protein